MSPHIAFRDDSDKLYNNYESELEDEKADWKDKIKKNVIVGVKIKWKFWLYNEQKQWRIA